MKSLAEPSEFWRALAAEQAADLQQHGFETIKRRQALRYFTWRWSWSSLRTSRQMRFLLRHTPPTTALRCAAASADLSDGSWAGVPWRKSDRWLYVFAVRLLWEFAARNDTLGVLKFPEPDLGGPLPVEWHGRLISQDLANSALEAGAIARALQGQEPTSILEVGAGYGRVAYVLLNAFPDARYTIIDIEPALTISRWYLTKIFPPSRLRFVHADAPEIDDLRFDLAISISSLQEMTRAQLHGYISLFDRLVRGVVYLKQRAHWANEHDGVTLRFDEYPIPGAWRRVFDEVAPVQSDFRQAAWSVS